MHRDVPALDARRIFLSAVTAEFARYRIELADRFRRVSVEAVFHLHTAALHQHLADAAAAARCYLDAAQQIAERRPMLLHLTDVHSHRARLFREKAELAKTRTLIERHACGRRTEELADAEAASQSW